MFNVWRLSLFFFSLMMFRHPLHFIYWRCLPFTFIILMIADPPPPLPARSIPFSAYRFLSRLIILDLADEFQVSWSATELQLTITMQLPLKRYSICKALSHNRPMGHIAHLKNQIYKHICAKLWSYNYHNNN